VGDVPELLRIEDVATIGGDIHGDVKVALLVTNGRHLIDRHGRPCEGASIFVKQLAAEPLLRRLHSLADVHVVREAVVGADVLSADMAGGAVAIAVTVALTSLAQARRGAVVKGAVEDGVAGVYADIDVGSETESGADVFGAGATRRAVGVAVAVALSELTRTLRRAEVWCAQRVGRAALHTHVDLGVETEERAGIAHAGQAVGAIRVAVAVALVDAALAVGAAVVETTERLTAAACGRYPGRVQAAAQFVPVEFLCGISGILCSSIPRFDEPGRGRRLLLLRGARRGLRRFVLSDGGGIGPHTPLRYAS